MNYVILLGVQGAEGVQKDWRCEVFWMAVHLCAGGIQSTVRAASLSASTSSIVTTAFARVKIGWILEGKVWWCVSVKP